MTNTRIVQLIIISLVLLILAGCRVENHNVIPTPTPRPVDEVVVLIGDDSHEWTVIVSGGRWVQTRRLIDDEFGIVCYHIVAFDGISCSPIGESND